MATQTRPKWVRVGHGNPCHICEKTSWCTISEDGVFCRCMRVESSKESLGADGSIGWIHKLSDPRPAIHASQKQIEPLSTEQATAIAQKAFRDPKAESVREKLSKSLGVSVQSLERLRVGVGYDEYNGREYSSWPSRNTKGGIIGISRRYGDGTKKTYPGTKNGLFYPIERDDLGGPILIVEGGSDVAAAISVGIRSIGRPSNTGGAEWIKRMVSGQVAFVVAENDEKPEKRGILVSCPSNCAGCGNCFPGLFGAKVVAEKIGCQYIMPPDGCKDLREIVAKGAVWWSLLREWN